MKQVYVLSFKDVQTINKRILQRHEDKERGISVAVVDAQGELLSYYRTENCPPSTIQIAINKAFTAARDRQSTASLQENSMTYDFHITDLGDLRYTGLSGGLPIIYKGEYVGAVGVSGLTQVEDTELAEWGIQEIGE